MSVRYKLDTCGIKLKLKQWNDFSLEARESLVTHPCEQPQEVEAYRLLLSDLIRQQCAEPEVKTLAIDPKPAWLEDNVIPEQLQSKAQERAQLTLTPTQWRSLSPLQRFALIKLSRPGHESHNFLPALAEFGLGES